MRSGNSHKGFTLIEIMVSIIIFSMLLMIAFSQLSFVVQTVTRIKHQILLVNDSYELYNDLHSLTRIPTFYSYSSLTGPKNAPFDMENQYRNDLQEIIEDGINHLYGNGYTIGNSSTCISKYNPDIYYDEKDLYKISESLGIDTCFNDIGTSEFQNNYNILSSIDFDNISVNIYLVFQSKLHRISTSLNTNLNQDSIILNNFINGDSQITVYDDFYVYKFHGISGNYCNDFDQTECTFYDFQAFPKNNGNVSVKLVRLNEYGEDINIPTSSYLEKNYSIN